MYSKVFQAGVFMKRAIKSLIIFTILSALIITGTADAQDSGVKAVLFYSPTCAHCHKVITEDLPLIWQAYENEVDVKIYSSADYDAESEESPALVGLFGSKLSILYVDVSTDIGSQLFSSALEAFDALAEGYVPTMIVGETRLVGGISIPEQLPAIIDQGLAQGGIDWPAIPGLNEAISTLILMPTENPESAGSSDNNNTDPAEPPTNTTKPTMLDLFNQDPVGNGLSVVVLLGMLVSVGFVFSSLRNPHNLHNPHNPTPIHWVILPILVLGFVVAGYLSYVETSGVVAVCGPVGDCNTVQNSSYAVLLGLIHVGTLGIIGYITITIAWVMSLISSRRIADYALMAIFAMAIFGTLFSIYLTFLEPFVIGATCAWCLTSAVLMTVILLLSVKPAAHAYARIHKTRKKRH
jgi:uncharacterized membrane protein